MQENVKALFHSKPMTANASEDEWKKNISANKWFSLFTRNCIETIYPSKRFSNLIRTSFYLS